MTNFKDALARGMQANERAKIARREIDEVLKAASEEVSAFLNARVDLRIEGVGGLKGLGLAFQSLASTPPPREKVTALVANYVGERRVGLAEVQFSEVGFPVTMRWDHEYQQAGNREEFEQALSALFASATTGEKLSKLVTQAA
jgi:hypothetical protein